MDLFPDNCLLMIDNEQFVVHSTAQAKRNGKVEFREKPQQNTFLWKSFQEGSGQMAATDPIDYHVDLYASPAGPDG